MVGGLVRCQQNLANIYKKLSLSTFNWAISRDPHVKWGLQVSPIIGVYIKFPVALLVRNAALILTGDLHACRIIEEINLLLLYRNNMNLLFRSQLLISIEIRTWKPFLIEIHVWKTSNDWNRNNRFCKSRFISIFNTCSYSAGVYFSE